ncbi:MAG TPA: hypothetical protein VMU57_15780 [Edaphobacter sp.]|uniref:hypothetical protein n=1 Tax=Edaphobacter sp. TaxID=1934404 RepID=UPI002C1542CC|nr:hypothetical protein [Edaphobacter sp.]HUZ96363.1 hypothetical protein [Edaphobacter sp.]
MNRRYGPSLLFVSFLALFLLPCAGWSAPQVAADAAYAKKIEAMLPPKVECVVSSPTVIAGQSVTLTAQVHGASAGLVYSFSSNGGRLYPDGSTARLDTTGVAAGRMISATCQVVNGVGRRGSANTVVLVVSMQAAKAAGHPPVAESAEVSAKNVLGGNGGSPQGGIPPRTSHDYAAQAALAAEVQAAPPSSSSRQTEAEEIPPVAATAPAAAAAAAPPPQAAGSADPYRESELQAQWVRAVKNGKIDYVIPTQMKLHDTAVVTVVLHGFADTSPNDLAGAKEGVLKVSPYMRMQLTADNPDEFEIDPKVGAVLPVPINSSAKWTWNVKPNQPAKNQKLTIEAFMVRTETGEHPQELLPSYVATVNVNVPGFWEWLWETFWNDPAAAIKYVLPGGAGFTALAALIVWWWKRRHPSEDKPKKEEE